MNLAQYVRFFKKYKKVDKFKTMKDYIVIFTENNAHVSKDPQQLKDCHDWPNVLYAPSLTDVRGVPPHFWKLRHGKVVPMNTFERAVRARELEHFGVDNELKKLEDDPRFIRKDGPMLVKWIMKLDAFLVMFILGLVVGSASTYYSNKYSVIESIIIKVKQHGKN